MLKGTLTASLPGTLTPARTGRARGNIHRGRGADALLLAVPGGAALGLAIVDSSLTIGTLSLRLCKAGLSTATSSPFRVKFSRIVSKVNQKLVKIKALNVRPNLARVFPIGYRHPRERGGPEPAPGMNRGNRISPWVPGFPLSRRAVRG